MIKFFKSDEIITTKFTAIKDQLRNNIVVDNFLYGNENEDILYPIILTSEVCDDNTSGSCSPLSYVEGIALSPSYEFDIEHQDGLHIHSSSIFYPSSSVYFNAGSNPLNTDGTYKRQVYNTIKKMYYNDYNNSYNIFGVEGFDTSKTKLNLANEFTTINLKVSDGGDKIQPNTVKIKNQSGDITSDIIDDGYNNLIMSGSHFINKYEIGSDSTLTTKRNEADYGVASVIQN